MLAAVKLFDAYETSIEISIVEALDGMYLACRMYFSIAQTVLVFITRNCETSQTHLSLPAQRNPMQKVCAKPSTHIHHRQQGLKETS